MAVSYAPEWAWDSGNPWGCCDRCGFKYRRSELFKEWTGQIVCAADLDPRDPQTNPPKVWPEGVAIKDARPEPPNIFVDDDNPQTPEDL